MCAAPVHGAHFAMYFVAFVRLADDRVRIRLVLLCRLAASEKDRRQENRAEAQHFDPG